MLVHAVRQRTPGVGHPAPPASWHAGLRPTSSCTCPCAPSHVRVGGLRHDVARGLRSAVRAAEGGSPVCACAIPFASAPLPHPATPVQHQPTSRSTTLRRAAGRSGAAGLPGRSGFRGAWSRARRPGGWPMEHVDVRCYVWSGMLPPTRATKKRPWTSPLCRRLPVCAVSGGVERAARSGASCACVWCCDRTIVYRRYAIAGREQTSSQLCGVPR